MDRRLPELKVSDDQLRSMVIEYLAECQHVNPHQLNDLWHGVPRVACKRGLGGTADPVGATQAFSPQTPSLSEPDFVRCRDIIWDLIVEGVVRPGHLSSDSHTLPHFHITERGLQFLEDGSLSPRDRDGYLKRLDSAVPGLDPVIRTYLIESLHTFRIGSLLSSTITLGCASEKAIMNLIDAYAAALPTHDGEALRRKMKGKGIKAQFDEFTKSAETHLKPAIASSKEERLKDVLDTTIKGIFELYRVHRNDAGHPTGKQLSSEEADSHLKLFSNYINNLYRLIDWLTNNKVP